MPGERGLAGLAPWEWLLIAGVVLLAAAVAYLVWSRTRLMRELAAAERASAASRVALEAAEKRQADLDARLEAERSDGKRERESVVRREALLAERESRVHAEHAELTERASRLEAQGTQVAGREAAMAAREQELDVERARIAGLSREDAAAEVIASAEHEARARAAAVARTIEAHARDTAEQQAREIVAGAIARVAADQTAESVVATVDLPSEEMKGRIIGREGRNIRAFEQVTGVNVLIDDTPASVLLSSFDPVRREVARVSLSELVADGRIHPQRIEEVYQRSVQAVTHQMHTAARDALAEVGIFDLHPELVSTLGTLKFRTSHGQNVLGHLVESAQLAALMAAELGVDVATSKRAAFLHDIGKALTHEHEGSHAIVGAALAKKYGEAPDIVHAIEAHHNEVEPHTVEAVLTQAADAISGSRPGARRESLETYVKRLERLEEIASSLDGVERAFAMQAGRELRVMVSPSVVDDTATATIAHQIARQVESELTYPGPIRVTVVRESRAIEVAN